MAAASSSSSTATRGLIHALGDAEGSVRLSASDALVKFLNVKFEISSLSHTRATRAHGSRLEL
jgi:hypothetical protein